MTRDEAAKVFAVKYVLNYNTFMKSERLRDDLLEIRRLYSDDAEFQKLWEKYNNILRGGEIPRWARMIMAERYGLNV